MYPSRRCSKCPPTAARLMSQMTETGKAWPPGPIVTLSDVMDGATSEGSLVRTPLRPPAQTCCVDQVAVVVGRVEQAGVQGPQLVQ